MMVVFESVLSVGVFFKFFFFVYSSFGGCKIFVSEYAVKSSVNNYFSVSFRSFSKSSVKVYSWEFSIRDDFVIFILGTVVFFVFVVLIVSFVFFFFVFSFYGCL